MVFAGMQKLSLLDYPGVVACTLFTLGCNFRCPWCHNAGLVLPEQFPEGTLDGEEVLRFLKKRQGILDGVAVTGGEPLLHEELADFLPEVKALGYRVKLDTNGSVPERLINLVERGLVDRVAMDVKNGPSHYGRTIGLKGAVPAAVEKTKDYLLSGPVDYEFRTTVVRELHRPEDMADIGRWLAGAKRYYIQCFQDSGDLISSGLTPFTRGELEELLAAVKPFIPYAVLRGVD